MKKFLGFLLLLLISANAFSQANEQDINALSIFSEYVKAKNYDAAFEPWMELRERSPKFNSAIYRDGSKANSNCDGGISTPMILYVINTSN